MDIKLSSSLALYLHFKFKFTENRNEHWISCDKKEN